MNINILVEQRLNYNNQSKINASTMAYKIVYGHYPKNIHRGKIGETKIWNGMTVDKHLDIKILKDLNSINNIEIRSVCEGHSKDDVLFVIFRPFNQDLNYIKKVSNYLNSCNDVLCGYDVGNNGKYRICCTSKLWYDMESDNIKWTNWWINISKHIKSALV